MNKNNGTIANVKEASTLVRSVFGPGMLLQHEDLEQLNAYTRELSRLMFRSLFGCGVVCGLVVECPTQECGKVSVTVRAGLALDCAGDPVYVPKDQRVVIDENCAPDLSGPLWVVLCRAIKRCAPRTSMCASDDDEPTSVCTRERDMYEIRVVNAPPDCACGCPEPAGTEQRLMREDSCKCVDPDLPCYHDHYAGECGCNCDGGSNCDCDCILLALLNGNEKDGWTVDHGVRRFIRPVLMRDPKAKQQKCKEEKALAQAPNEVQIPSEKLQEANAKTRQMADLAQKELQAENQRLSARLLELEEKFQMESNLPRQAKRRKGPKVPSISG